MTVTVLVKNTGESKGSYEVNYKVNNEFLQYKTVTIDGGTQQTLTVTIIGKKAGTNTLNVNDLSDTFTVKAPPPSTDTTTPAVIPWQEAKNHIGETITVEGPIIDKFDIGTAMLLGMGKSATDSGTVGIEISYSLASELPADLFVGLTIKATGLTYINPLGGCSLKVNAASDIEVVE
ncbi:MAG: hypothetical protein A2Y90_04465 [Chloroflexi bacterium RBG_13_52_12]|nr:MAG: hypothetical protein A2Y90_04465 [Chloroflexi bacterium RBG_13_52_12]